MLENLCLNYKTGIISKETGNAIFLLFYFVSAFTFKDLQKSTF